MKSAVGQLDVKVRRWRRRVRGELFARWVRFWGGTAGARILLDSGLKLRHLPHSGWCIGDDVYFAQGVILDIRSGATFSVGARSKIMHYVIIGSSQRVAIGDDCQIAELSSIRDADHGIDQPGLISKSPLNTLPIEIGNNCWVGRGCALIRGATLGPGAVVGANSVVRSEIPGGSIAVGIPARVVRLRKLDSGS